MNKILRFSFLSMLMMLFGINSYADDVTFDFSGSNAYEQFGLAGFSANGVSDGDFTENKSVTVNGVTLTVSPSTTNTPNRMWSGSLRLYGGTLTISSKQAITALNFTLNSNKWGNNSCSAGSFTSNGVWSGSANEIVITIGGNTQIKSLTVTVGGEVGPVDPDPDPDPVTDEVKKVTVAEFNAAAESTDVWYQLTGTVKNLKDGDIYGNFDLEDESGSVYVYGLLSEKGGAKKQFQQLVAEKGIQNGSKITIIGNRGSYKDKIEVLNAYFVSIEGTDTPEPVEEEVKEVSVADFNAAAESTSVWYQLTGAVTNLKEGDQYGNFDLVDATGSVYVYGLLSEKGGAKKQFQQLVADQGIEEGTKIVIIGHRGSYKGKIEVTDAYFVRVVAEEEPAAETTATFDATKDLGNAERGEGSITKEGVTLKNADGILGNGQQYRFYANTDLTFSVPGGTITKIEFTSTANATSNNGLGGFEAPATGTWTVDGRQGVWTGAASTVVFHANKQVRATLITVTYTAGGAQGGAAGASQLSKYPYAKPELIAKAKELLEQGEEAAEQLAEVMKEVARSHSHGEGLAEAEDITDQLSGEWTLEEFANGEGIEGEGYFKAEGKDIVARVYQTVELKAGRYMLTATGRGQKYPTIAENIDERLQVMAINNDRLGRYQSIARNDREGGVYGEGWDDASDFFTMTADGEAVLGAYFQPIAGRDSWAEVGNFRLVRLGDATRYISQYEEFYNDQAAQLDLLVHRVLKQGEWNSLVLPLDLGVEEIEAQFGKGTQVATLSKATDGVVEFLSLKEAAIEANVPVLVKPTAVKESNRYLFRNVAISTTVSTVVKVDGFDFVGYYNPNENPVKGGLGFDVMEVNGAYAALTTSAALVPTGDAEVQEVLIDGETYWTASEPEAKMAIIGAMVPSTPTAIEAVETAQQAGAIYNIAGQRIGKLQKGINIVGGKKIVVK